MQKHLQLLLFLYTITMQIKAADLAQLVELLNRNQWVAGSNPAVGTIYFFSHGCLAQLGEHLFDVQKVGGSIPSASTIDKKTMSYHRFYFV